MEITLLRFVCKFASYLGSLLSFSCSHRTGSQTYPLTSRPSLENSWASTSIIPMALSCGTLTRACCFSLLRTPIYICVSFSIYSNSLFFAPMRLIQILNIVPLFQPILQILWSPGIDYVYCLFALLHFYPTYGKYTGKL